MTGVVSSGSTTQIDLTPSEGLDSTAMLNASFSGVPDVLFVLVTRSGGTNVTADISMTWSEVVY